VAARVACGSASRQRVGATAHSTARGSVWQRVAAACEVRRESGASLAGRKQQLLRSRRAHGSGSAVAHRHRHGLQVVTAASCASVSGSPPARANVSAPSNAARLATFPAQHTAPRATPSRTRGYPVTAHNAPRKQLQKRVRVARAARRRLLKTSVCGPGAVGARATAAKMRAAGSANTRAAAAGGARGGVQSWRRGGRFSLFQVLLLVRRASLSRGCESGVSCRVVNKAVRAFTFTS
jgi:hypothetical protein